MASQETVYKQEMASEVCFMDCIKEESVVEIKEESDNIDTDHSTAAYQHCDGIKQEDADVSEDYCDYDCEVKLEDNASDMVKVETDDKDHVYTSNDFYLDICSSIVTDYEQKHPRDILTRYSDAYSVLYTYIFGLLTLLLQLVDNCFTNFKIVMTINL